MTLTMSPTFVLVPGAWQGGWAWQPVARRLREIGYAAVTVTLPGLADGDDRAGLRLSDAIDHVVAEVERRDLAEVVLVGQSWGGYSQSVSRAMAGSTPCISAARVIRRSVPISTSAAPTMLAQQKPTMAAPALPWISSPKNTPIARNRL